MYLTFLYYNALQMKTNDTDKWLCSSYQLKIIKWHLEVQSFIVGYLELHEYINT